MVSPMKDRQDIQRLIRLVLDAPVYKTKGRKPNPVVELEGDMSIEDIKGKNTTVATRILTVQALQAVNGELKSAEFLMKYGGLEPVKEQTVTLETPTFVDDLDGDEEQAPQYAASGDGGDDAESAILKSAVLYNDPDEST